MPHVFHHNKNNGSPELERIMCVSQCFPIMSQPLLIQSCLCCCSDIWSSENPHVISIIMSNQFNCISSVCPVMLWIWYTRHMLVLQLCHSFSCDIRLHWSTRCQLSKVCPCLHPIYDHAEIPSGICASCDYTPFSSTQWLCLLLTQSSLSTLFRIPTVMRECKSKTTAKNNSCSLSVGWLVLPDKPHDGTALKCVVAGKASATAWERSV